MTHPIWPSMCSAKLFKVAKVAKTNNLYMTVHNCKGVSVDHYAPDNSHGLTISVRGEDDSVLLSLVLFDLPVPKITALIALFGTDRLREKHHLDPNFSEETPF